MSDGAERRERLSRTARSAERTLWIGAISLTVFSIVGMVYSNWTWTTSTNEFPPVDPIASVVANVFSTFAQSTLVGGILCAGLALAVTALSAQWRAVALDTAGGAEVEAVEQQRLDDRTAASLALRPVPDPAPGSRPLDAEAFKRPRPDKHPAS